MHAGSVRGKRHTLAHMLDYVPERIDKDTRPKTHQEKGAIETKDK